MQEESSESRITLLLNRWRESDPEALDELLPLVYRQLCIIARKYMRGERRDHSFSTRDLVHEVYCKLFGKGPDLWENRVHFFAVAAKAMRFILINRAKRRNAQKRDGEHVDWMAVELEAFGDEPEKTLADLDIAITRLEERDRHAAWAIELFYFFGMTAKEIAEVLPISRATVNRKLQFAKAWLARYLDQGPLPKAMP